MCESQKRTVVGRCPLPRQCIMHAVLLQTIRVLQSSFSSVHVNCTSVGHALHGFAGSMQRQPTSLQNAPKLSHSDIARAHAVLVAQVVWDKIDWIANAFGLMPWYARRDDNTMVCTS